MLLRIALQRFHVSEDGGLMASEVSWELCTAAGRPRTLAVQ